MAVNHLLELILRGEGFATSFSDEGDIGTEVDAPAKDSPENQGRQLVEKAKEKLREERAKSANGNLPDFKQRLTPQREGALKFTRHTYYH